MKIMVVGLGYVGLAGAAALAKLGHHVRGVDLDSRKVKRLQSGESVIHEPGLEELVAAGLRSGMLMFAHTKEVKRETWDAVMVAVGTPSSHDGSADLSQVIDAVRWITDMTIGATVLVMKSSVPPGTGVRIARDELSGDRIHYVANPEFLREGHAIYDWRHPHRIVIGAQDPEAAEKVESIYSSIETKVVRTDVTSAEMIKYASNALLVTKISFINEIAALCELVGGHIDDVAYGTGLDPRLGPDFLRAGLGWGGSCFPKDVSALQALALKNGRSFDLLNAVVSVNNQQKLLPLQSLKDVFGQLQEVRVAVLGLTFKPGTDDLREAASIEIISALLTEGASVRAYDPVAVDNARAVLPQSVYLTSEVRKAIQGAEAALLVTEWPEIVGLPWEQIASWMDAPRFVFDGRNALNRQSMIDFGFKYRGVGRAEMQKDMGRHPLV